MIVITEKEIQQIGVDWHQTIGIVEEAVQLMRQDDFAQPIKPYLRYRDLKNRIISMPAFIGGQFNVAGIKWIASFPGNLKKGIPRAHSIVILNDADTGTPLGTINTALLSVIRTASVSGLVLDYYLRSRPSKKLKVGITGWGPIGQYHAHMVRALLKDQLEELRVFDIRSIKDSPLIKASDGKIISVGSWQEAYVDMDVFITCTVSDQPYIDLAPKPGSLHLNVSLRDYKAETYPFFKDAMIVDDWEEVCRENTDIERMALTQGLSKDKTQSIKDIVSAGDLKQYGEQATIMFNPMGMGVFDIALGKYYLDETVNQELGVLI